MPGEAHSAVACQPLLVLGAARFGTSLSRWLRMWMLVRIASCHPAALSPCVVSLPTKNVKSSGAGDIRTSPTTLVPPCLHASSATWCCNHNCLVHPDATPLSGAVKACQAVTLPNCRKQQHMAGTVPLRQTHSLGSTIMTLEEGFAPNGYARQPSVDDHPQVWSHWGTP